MLKLDIAGIGKEKGKTFHAEADETIFVGLKIGDAVQGKDVLKTLDGYELIIAGASDKSGFPSFAEIEGAGRKRLLLTYGKGMRQTKPKGLRLRKTVRGNTIAADIAQINLKVKKEGSKALSEIFGVAAAEGTGEEKILSEKASETEKKASDEEKKSS